MTVDTTGSDGTVAIPEEDLYTGLEDFTTEDLVMPRLKIDHSRAVFIDNLTNAEMTSIDAVLLGLVKGRVLWPAEVGSSDQPLCKSLDFIHGRPDVDSFPWTESMLSPSATYEKDGEQILLPCSACNLKEWNTNPRGTSPWCSEQHTLPLLMISGIEGDEPLYAPALLTVQRSGIAPSRAYLSGFVRTRTAAYTAVTRISLTQQRRGSVDYAVPKFVEIGKTDPDRYPVFAQQFRSIRDFLHTPRSRDEDAEVAETTPTPAASPATASDVPVDDDSDLPF